MMDPRGKDGSAGAVLGGEGSSGHNMVRSPGAPILGLCEQQEAGQEDPGKAVLKKRHLS